MNLNRVVKLLTDPHSVSKLWITWNILIHYNLTSKWLLVVITFLQEYYFWSPYVVLFYTNTIKTLINKASLNHVLVDTVYNMCLIKGLLFTLIQMSSCKYSFLGQNICLCFQSMLYDRHVNALQRLLRHYTKGFVSFL